MPVAKVTVKGQVTIPKEVREQLQIKDGDSVRFEVAGDRATIERVVQPSVLDFYGAFPATKPYPGKEHARAVAMRSVGDTLAAKGQPS